MIYFVQSIMKNLYIKKITSLPFGRYANGSKKGFKTVLSSSTNVFRPPSDGGLMIPPWTKNDVW